MKSKKELAILFLLISINVYSQETDKVIKREYEIIKIDTCNSIDIAFNDTLNIDRLKVVIREIRSDYSLPKLINVGFLNNVSKENKHPHGWSPGSKYLIVGTYYEKKKEFYFNQKIKGVKRKIKIE